MKKQREPLTYARCRILLGGRQWKKLSPTCRLYRGGEHTFVIKATSYHRKKWDSKLGRWIARKDKEVYDPPIAIIYPHDVAVLNNEAAPSVAAVAYRNFFGLNLFRRTDPRSSIKHWWTSKAHQTLKDAQPFARGMQFDILNGKAVSALPQEQRLRVDLKKAKPIRERIADWKKFAQTYVVLMERWDGDNWEKLQAAGKADRGFPELGEEPSEEGFYRLIVAATTPSDRIWDFNPYVGFTMAPQDRVKLAKEKFNLGFEMWKKRLYEQHGVFTWVDKAAA